MPSSSSHLQGFVDECFRLSRLRSMSAGSPARRQTRCLELVAALLETRHFAIERRRALDQRRVRAFASAARRASVLQRLARVAEPMLRVRQLLVGGALLLFEPSDRFARLALPRFEATPLLFGAAPLDFEQLGLLLHLLQIVRRPLQLQLERQNRLLFAMQIGVDGRSAFDTWAIRVSSAATSETD